MLARKSTPNSIYWVGGQKGLPRPWRVLQRLKNVFWSQNQESMAEMGIILKLGGL